MPEQAVLAEVAAAQQPLADLDSSSTAAVNAHIDAHAIAEKLIADSYVIVDSFLADGGAALHELLLSFRAENKLALGSVAAGRAAAAYARITKVALPRGDMTRWLTPAETREHGALRNMLAQMDALIEALRADPLLAEELEGTSLYRDEMQATCYPGDGARYVRHIDNNSGAGWLACRLATGGGQRAGGGTDAEGVAEQRPRRTGRRITMITYANPSWETGHGGELRLHPQVADAEGQLSDGPHFDVAPLSGRLVLFWSDERMPHQVLPSHRDRFAVSIWYEDAANEFAELKKKRAEEGADAADPGADAATGVEPAPETETETVAVERTVLLNSCRARPAPRWCAMPTLGFGTYRSGGAELKAALLLALKKGYRLIDTAAMYGNEETVRDAIVESGVPRRELFVTTKLWNDDHGAERTRAAVAKSLRLLGLSCAAAPRTHRPGLDCPACPLRFFATQVHRPLFDPRSEECRVQRSRGRAAASGELGSHVRAQRGRWRLPALDRGFQLYGGAPGAAGQLEPGHTGGAPAAPRTCPLRPLPRSPPRRARPPPHPHTTATAPAHHHRHAREMMRRRGRPGCTGYIRGATCWQRGIKCQLRGRLQLPLSAALL